MPRVKGSLGMRLRKLLEIFRDYSALIACDNGKIGTYAKLVDDRNESAHPNGEKYESEDANSAA